MILTGHSLIANKIVTLCEFSKVSQVGIDLSVCKIQEIVTEYTPSFILKDETVINPNSYVEVDLEDSHVIKGKTYEGWWIGPGVYEMTFNEGCNLGKNHTAFLIQRSSVTRTCGGISTKSVFDPGFSTQQIGTVFYIPEPIFIEKNARIGQLVVFENHEVEEGYNGQFQGDKQRELLK